MPLGTSWRHTQEKSYNPCCEKTTSGIWTSVVQCPDEGSKQLLRSYPGGGLFLTYGGKEEIYNRI